MGVEPPGDPGAAAAVAAQLAGVRIEVVEDIGAMREISSLFARVWGLNAEGVPVPSEMLRSLAHAGGLVSGALDSSGALVGAAVLGRAEAAACYSFIAGVSPWTGDSGIGFALKQHQRAWALARGIDTMRWTFDPLVGRNARFNLTKLGARAARYEPEFYGRMSDDINGVDVADRLVATWELGSLAADRAANGAPADCIEPDVSDLDEVGPDGAPAYAVAERVRWCRVPADIVALRRVAPAEATDWRDFTRRHLQDALGGGFVAVGASRSGWYRLEKESQ